MRRPVPLPAGPGQESVWDYPRPPRLEPTPRRLTVAVAGRVIADTTRAMRVLETSHPPVYYFPPEDVSAAVLRAEPIAATHCEWKGRARYFDVFLDDRLWKQAAWSYPEPVPEFAAIRDWIAFYAGRVDRCTVDGQLVTPQPGDFYGGWITPDVVGPFKGGPGSWGW